MPNAAPGFELTSGAVSASKDEPQLGSPHDAHFTIDRFCYQYLQMESHLDYPDGRIMRSPEVQKQIFDRIFANQSTSSPKKTSVQLRTLKELVRRIQDNISEEETDDYEVSDSFMDRIGELMSIPQVPGPIEAQQKFIVSYRLSFLQKPVMIDILENRTLIAAGGTTGFRTWEAALHLGQFLCANSDLVSGKRILELGAGTGYLSILCGKHLAAAHVTASDGSEEVVDNLADNFALNDVHWSHNPATDATVRPRLLKWGHALVGTEESDWNGGRQVDLIIGADITYDQRANPALVSTLKDLLDHFSDADIVITAIERNETTLNIFQELCSQTQLHVEEVGFSVDTAHKEMCGKDVLTPFYSAIAPIHIFRISKSTG